MTYILVIYDIHDNKRRNNATETLKAMGYIRIQRSAYITRGGTATAKDTARALMRIIDPRTDSVLILTIDAYTYTRAIKLGTTRETTSLNQNLVII